MKCSEGAAATATVAVDRAERSRGHLDDRTTAATAPLRGAAMPCARELTRPVRITDPTGDWTPDAPNGRFEIMLVTDDDPPAVRPVRQRGEPWKVTGVAAERAR
jgi:hypothetical protein